MSRRLRVLDLCSGKNGWTAAFRERGHDVLGVELEPKFRPELNLDVRHLAKHPHALLAALVEPGWVPDVVVASPPCEGFSVASMGKMWIKGANPPVPKHDTSRYGLSVLKGVLRAIAELQPAFFWIENPRGMMRKMPQMQGFRNVTVSYCSYGEQRQKPTDLWGRWPTTWAPRPFCNGDPDKGTKTLLGGRVFVLDKNGRPCHEMARRGAKTGTQGIKGSADRAVVARQLSKDVALACEAALLPSYVPQPYEARSTLLDEVLA